MIEKIEDKKIIENLISNAEYLQLGLCKNNMPYIVPMSFVYRNGVIYMHSSKTGTKMDFIRNNENVCFEIDFYHGIFPGRFPCSYNMKYQSVIGFGTATILEDDMEKREGMQYLIDNYHTGEYCIDNLDLSRVAVIRIDVTELHGKQSGMDRE